MMRFVALMLEVRLDLGCRYERHSRPVRQQAKAYLGEPNAGPQPGYQWLGIWVGTRVLPKPPPGTSPRAPDDSSETCAHVLQQCLSVQHCDPSRIKC